MQKAGQMHVLMGAVRDAMEEEGRTVSSLEKKFTSDVGKSSFHLVVLMTS
jgi:hypothetical protein